MRRRAASSERVFNVLGSTVEDLDIFHRFYEIGFFKDVPAQSHLWNDHTWGANHFVLGGAVNTGLYGGVPTLQLDGPGRAGERVMGSLRRFITR